MKKLTISLIILVTIFSGSSLFSSKLAKKTNYSVEETARILRSKKIGNLELDHDDHVYKCIKISKNAADLEGAVDALVAFKTRFGYTLDDNEVQLIIRLSKLDTTLYEEFAFLSKAIGKKETTIKEHFNMVIEAEKGNGKYLKLGLDRAYACGYKMENDYFSAKRLSLLVNVGKIATRDKFLDIYSALRRIGMDKKINTRSLELMYNLSTLKGDVPGIIKGILLPSKWRSRRQPGQREYYVIRDLLYRNDKNYNLLKGDYKQQNYDSDEDNNVEVRSKPVVKKANKSAALKKTNSKSKKKKYKKRSSKKTTKRSAPKVQKTTAKKHKHDKSCVLHADH